MKYDPKVSTLEERDDLDALTVDELHGIFTAYEMRMGQNDFSRKEAAFKAINEPKNSRAQSKNHSEISDDEEGLFIKKLERGTRKYEGKLPLKCFRCGSIGHFASKCPYPKQDDSDQKESSRKFKKGKMGNKNKYYEKKKILYTMEDSEYEDTSGDEET